MDGKNGGKVPMLKYLRYSLVALVIIATPFLIYPTMYLIGGVFCTASVSIHSPYYQGVQYFNCWEFAPTEKLVVGTETNITPADGRVTPWQMALSLAGSVFSMIMVVLATAIFVLSVLMLGKLSKLMRKLFNRTSRVIPTGAIKEHDLSPRATSQFLPIGEGKVFLFARWKNHTFYLKKDDCGMAKFLVLNGKKFDLRFNSEYPGFLEVPQLVPSDFLSIRDASFE